MKRFMIMMLSGAATLLIVVFLVFSVGVYIPLDWAHDKDIPFRTEGTLLQCRLENGTYEPLVIRGVEVSASMPGHYGTEYYAKKEDYLRWFAQIDRMGANTVKALRVMNHAFYDALYEYNQKQAQPLYLIQGISICDEVNHGSGNAYDDDFKGSLKADGRTVVDIIHGRKLVLLEDMEGSGGFYRDISQWVIGFVVGSDWNVDMIAYTDHKMRHKGYQGNYFSASSDASAFETMLAEVMDEITAYETEKYHSQHPIGFLNSPSYDFLDYAQNYKVQLKKYSYLDPEHVLASDQMEAGSFAAYRLFDYCDDFSAYLSEEQKEKYKDILAGLDRASSFDGYMQFLSRYHTMPVLASEYGISSARGIVSIKQAPCTEEAQGEQLVAVYKDAVKFGWAGVCISSWQDAWEQKNWNTSFSTDMKYRHLWHDIQTEGQCYGLMAYEPGEGEATCILDGNPREWKYDDVVFSRQGQTLSARYDWKYLYLMLSGENISPDTVQYIPIDIAPDVGSTASNNPALHFSCATDFIVCIDGMHHSKLLVQDRYQAMRENFLFEMNGQNPFAHYPDKNSKDFVTVQMAVRKGALVENYTLLEPSVRKEQTGLVTWDTGKLVHGSGDPDDADYCSLSDFCFGDHCVEIRIPWLLLNVSDPVTMKVHEDYYENYGVVCKKISEIWLGIASQDTEKAPVRMERFPVNGTGRTPKYHERLKKSYDVIQKVWEEERGNEIY